MSQVIGLSPPQAQSIAVRSTPLDVSNKPSGAPDPVVISRASPAAVPAALQPKHQPKSPDLLADMLDKVNQSYDPFEIEAEFAMSENGKRVIVTLVNTRTGEIIRRIPPEHFASRFVESTGGLGLWFNQKV